MSHLSNFQAELRAHGFDAAIVTSEINQRYLTGFAFTDGYVLVSKTRTWMITDFRYVEAAKAAVDCRSIAILTPDSMSDCIAEILASLDTCRVAIEEEHLSLREAERLDFDKLSVSLDKGASAILHGLRIHKDDAELDAMRRAQAITDAAFERILGFLSPDRTELEVALELEFFMRSHGSEGVSFDTIAVSGTASSMPHGVPRHVKLERGFLTMDFGARVDGYCSDMTRTVVIGKATDEMKRIYNTVLTAQETALSAAAEGVGCRYLDTVARDVIENAGYHGTFGHSLGHGVGMLIHENPRLSPKANECAVLERGHVVTFEPGIYLAGKCGCRIEDMAAILPDGTFYNFTHSPKDLIEL